MAFDSSGRTDLRIGLVDPWQQVETRLPADWRPDVIFLYLPYTIIPRGLWSAPVPLAGLAPDWDFLWHSYSHTLPDCDLVLTDTPGVETLGRAGITHVRAANLFGSPASASQNPPTDVSRDIDLLVVGGMHPVLGHERLPWLGRLAPFTERWRVMFHPGGPASTYRPLLCRARIVFNYSPRGRCNRLVFEAAASGALLFQEAGNREVPSYLTDGQECVYYREENLEELLDHYLSHEEDRWRIAEAGRSKAKSYSFMALWQDALARIETEWPQIAERTHERLARPPADDALNRLWQVLSAPTFDDPSLISDLATALAVQPRSAALHNALGIAAAVTPGKQQGPPDRSQIERAAGHFRKAVEIDPNHCVAALNLAEALATAGQNRPAVEQASRALTILDRTAPFGADVLDAPHFPPGFDWFRVEWERAGWEHAGEPEAEGLAKRALVRWRLHTLLGQLTGDSAHLYEAALLRPDLSITNAALGQALLRAGRPNVAIPHLRQALDGNPLDSGTAEALHAAFGALGDADGQRRLARERRWLAQAAPDLLPREQWLTNAPPVGDELASILILCCNELEYTRRCIESVLRHTRPPSELVLVDNGSTDGTPAYLEELSRRSGPARVVVIRNEANRGYPAGCNQALVKARGQYVVFLNNDTVVTPGWLDGLIAWALADWPSIGLVGAVTNYAPPPQQVHRSYSTTLEGLDAFAARRRQQHRGKGVRVDQLSGFCVLARREVLEQVGGFDEQFGLGFFDDDDLCIRAREAGFQLIVALDTYIHHFGSRTFAGLGVDTRKQLETNFERFRTKWGPERTKGYRLLSPNRLPKTAEAVTAAEQDGQPPQEPAVAGDFADGVSLCMIVKNEEDNLAACLDSVVGLPKEIIVADTGSTDRTKEIAARYGAKVVDFPWVDSFAAARNASLRHATCKWVFWLDADDRLDDLNREKLRALFASLNEENVAYSMKCLCLAGQPGEPAAVVDHVRLFRNHPELRWKYRVHEQILPGLNRLNTQVRWADVVIHHVGYQDPTTDRKKQERNLRLLQLENAEHPEDPFTLFNLGSAYVAMGRPAEAMPMLQRSLALSYPSDSIVRKLYALLVQCHRKLGQQTEAMAACRAGRDCCPEDAELLFLEAVVRKEQGDVAGSEACLLELLGSREGAHFASVDTGQQGYKARHNLAVLYRDHGRLAEAEAQWRAALSEQPAFPPALLGLGELCLGQRRWTEVEELAGRLEAPDAANADLLRGRARLEQREFAQARKHLEAAIARSPEALWPRVILSYVLLQEGRDWVAAEKALRDILRLAPDNAEAKQNLAVLLRQQGRAGEIAQVLGQTG